MEKKIFIQDLSFFIYPENISDCADENKLRDFIENLIKILDMTVIFPTVIMRLPLKRFIDQNGNIPDPDDLGLTSFTGISESHIATHSWTNKTIYFNINSCRHFPTRQVEELIKDIFGKNSKIKMWLDERYSD